MLIIQIPKLTEKLCLKPKNDKALMECISLSLVVLNWFKTRLLFNSFLCIVTSIFQVHFILAEVISFLNEVSIIFQ